MDRNPADGGLRSLGRAFVEWADASLSSSVWEPFGSFWLILQTHAHTSQDSCVGVASAFVARYAVNSLGTEVHLCIVCSCSCASDDHRHRGEKSHLTVLNSLLWFFSIGRNALMLLGFWLIFWFKRTTGFGILTLVRLSLVARQPSAPTSSAHPYYRPV